jgi:hypothetical protein
VISYTPYRLIMHAQRSLILTSLLALSAIVGSVPTHSPDTPSQTYRGSGRIENAYRGSGRIENAYRGSGRIEVAYRGSGRIETEYRGSGRLEEG